MFFWQFEFLSNRFFYLEFVSVGCNYKGRSYEQGSLVNTDQPCLKCTCVIGNLVCHLQVCPELPDPPPQGCVIVHKKNKCCAHLQCYYGKTNSRMYHCIVIHAVQ